MQSAHGTAPQVLELASYHAIIACVAAGAARGGSQAVWDLMREPRPCACTPADLRHGAGAPRGYQSPALDALLAALQGTQQPSRRLDFIALTRLPFKKEPAHDLFTSPAPWHCIAHHPGPR